MATSLYYQVTEEEQSDEIPLEDVADLVEAGVIEADTLVWGEGLDGWAPWSLSKHLFGFVAGCKSCQAG